MKIIIFKELYILIFILQKETSEIQYKNEKDKYFAIFQRDKNYISSIEPLILIVHYTVTNEILVSRGILRPVRQQSGDTNFTASPHTHFLP